MKSALETASPVGRPFNSNADMGLAHRSFNDRNANNRAKGQGIQSDSR